MTVFDCGEETIELSSIDTADGVLRMSFAHYNTKEATLRLIVTRRLTLVGSFDGL